MTATPTWGEIRDQYKTYNHWGVNEALQQPYWHPLCPRYSRCELCEALGPMAVIVADDESLPHPSLARQHVPHEALSRLDNDELVEERGTGPHLGAKARRAKRDAGAKRSCERRIIGRGEEVLDLTARLGILRWSVGFRGGRVTDSTGAGQRDSRAGGRTQAGASYARPPRVRAMTSRDENYETHLVPQRPPHEPRSVCCHLAQRALLRPLRLDRITKSPTMSNQQLPPYVSLDISSISLALLVIGVYVCVIGQVSYWLKERLYISSALVSVAVGIGASPRVLPSVS